MTTTMTMPALIPAVGLETDEVCEFMGAGLVLRPTKCNKVKQLTLIIAQSQQLLERQLLEC